MTRRFLTLLLSGAIGLSLTGCSSTSPTMRAQSPSQSGVVFECPSGQCQSGQCNGSCMNLPFQPVHRNFHTYDVPGNLRYPNQQLGPATYQYPYYTTRGPTDFFWE